MHIDPARFCSGAIAVCALLGLIGLAAAVQSDSALSFDSVVRSAIHHGAAIMLTRLAFGLSLLASLWLLLSLSFVALLGLWLSGRRQAAIALAASMGGAIVLNGALKLVFHRARPEPFFGVAPETFSFPSGHVLFSFSFYGALSLIFLATLQGNALRAVIWSSVGLLVCAIGWSRVYLGVHYPTDVIGGLLVAIFWLGLLRAIGLFGARPKRGA